MMISWDNVIIIVTIIGIPLCLSCLFLIICKIIKLKYSNTFLLFIFTLSMSVLGSVVGYLMGMSRDPVVGAVLPAVLSLAGGIGVFTISKSTEAQILYVSSGILFLSIHVLVGSLQGAYDRQKWITYVESPEHKLEVAKQEMRLRLAKQYYEYKLEPLLQSYAHNRCIDKCNNDGYVNPN